ncbi:hypothetical protein [Sulfitobacter sabulilitoris]|uniref:Uncharacterized protein n=1 Tax=Sulfitobacter sabulilitoris TaxID=2562655 RepID=A0A5S3PP89_9RHOB|nr:hypothetical protein [Sulfitobacter sabulilitoris]TMM55410.1 hypothetical protein FDT80_07625 [Sulfitobacter sabulilitoris]
MAQGIDITGKADHLRRAIEAHLGVRGRDLDHALRRAGRRLPRRVRAQAQMIARAERFGGNPKLERRLDATRLAAAFDAVDRYLAQVDRADLRRARLIGILAVIAFNLVVIFALFVIWLRWRGYV